MLPKAVPTLSIPRSSPQGSKSGPPPKQANKANAKKGAKSDRKKGKSANGKKKREKKSKGGLSRLPSHSPHYGIENVTASDKKKRKKK